MHGKKCMGSSQSIAKGCATRKSKEINSSTFLKHGCYIIICNVWNKKLLIISNLLRAKAQNVARYTPTTHWPYGAIDGGVNGLAPPSF